MQDSVELRWYLSLVIRWLWLILVFSLIGAVSAFWVGSKMPPIYSASATLLVDQAPVDRSDYTAILVSERLVATYAQMLSRRPVLEAAIERLGLEETPDELARDLEVKLVPDTRLIKLSVTHNDPAQAALIADTLAEVFIVQIRAMQAERYADSLAGMQEQIGQLSALIEETQAHIDTLLASRIQGQAESARLEAVLADYRNTSGTLQQDYEEMHLIADQSTDNVLVVETARVPDNSAQPHYVAAATLEVRQTADTVVSSHDAILASEQLAGTYAQMLSRRSVLEVVIDRLGLAETPDELANRLQAKLVPNTSLVELSVIHTDPDQAARIANTIVGVFIAQIQALQEESFASPNTSVQEKMDNLSALTEEILAAINISGAKTIQVGTDNELVGEAATVPESSVQPNYNVTATLMVRQNQNTDQGGYDAILVSERLARTYTQMLSGRPVLEVVSERLELAETPDELANRLQVRSVPDTQLIQLGVTHTDPVQAALIANTIAEVFITQIQAMREGTYADSLVSLQEQMDELSSLSDETQVAIDVLDAKMIQEEAESARLELLLSDYRADYRLLRQDYEMMHLTAAQSMDNLNVVETAKIPESPVGPRTLVNTVLAAMVGAMLAVGVAFLLEYLDDTIKTPDDVSRTLGLGTLGVIGRLARGEGDLVAMAWPFSPITEAYRVLRTNIRFSSVDRPFQTLLVTSANPSEGKTVTVANLAVVMAQAELRVVVVDADLRRPRLDKLYGVPMHHEGLTQALLEGSADGRLQPVPAENLLILPAGDLPPNPAEMVGSRNMQKLLHELTQQADLVLIDAAPVLVVADATVLAPNVDGVLLVVEAGKTRREAARQAVENLRQVGANVIGVVLNAAPINGGSYYYQGNYTNETEKRKRGIRQWKESLAAVGRTFRRKLKAD